MSTQTAAQLATKKAAAQPKDALAKLKADHTKVKGLFAQYEKSKDKMSSKEKLILVATICGELKVHTQIEEEIFYPAVREIHTDELDELLDEAKVEHAGAKDLIAQLEGSNPGEPLYDAKVTVLGEQVKHHAGEEEDEMFPKVRKAKDLDLVELGTQLSARAEELTAKMGSK